MLGIGAAAVTGELADISSALIWGSSLVGVSSIQFLKFFFSSFCCATSPSCHVSASALLLLLPGVWVILKL